MKCRNLGFFTQLNDHWNLIPKFLLIHGWKEGVLWWMAFGWMDGMRMDGLDEDGWMDFHFDRIEWCFSEVLQRFVAQNPCAVFKPLTMADRPFYTAAWTKSKEKGVTIYTWPCRLCGGCRSSSCATGTI